MSFFSRRLRSKKLRVAPHIFIGTAEELVSKKHAILKESKMSIPTVTYDDLCYIVTLFRDGKEEKWTFGEHKVDVCACAESELNSFERKNIKGDAAADGIIYYIHARPYDVGAAVFVWLKDKEEAMALKNALREADGYDYEEEEDAVCTFCGKRPSTGCSEDHGDDMRDAQKAALTRD